MHILKILSLLLSLATSFPLLAGTTEPTDQESKSVEYGYTRMDHAIAREYDAIQIGNRETQALPMPGAERYFGSNAPRMALFAPEEMPAFRAMVQGILDKANAMLPKNKQMTFPPLYFCIKNSEEDPGILSKMLNLPPSKPEFLHLDKQFPNAFAVWLTDAMYMVNVGGYAFRALDLDELEAVVAHELGHVMKSHNFQKLGLKVVESIASPLPFPSLVTLAAKWYERSMEYEADAISAKLVNKPEKLVSALEKMVAYAHSPMFGGASPFQMPEIFSDHPSNANRKIALGVKDIPTPA